jgi:DNA-binding XRE family transcriptional regulator
MANALTPFKQLGSIRPFLLHEQTELQAGQMRRFSAQIRQTRRRFGYSRSRLAAALGVDLAVVVALENGYGNPDAARSILSRALRLSAGPADEPHTD